MKYNNLLYLYFAAQDNRLFYSISQVQYECVCVCTYVRVCVNAHNIYCIVCIFYNFIFFKYRLRPGFEFYDNNSIPVQNIWCFTHETRRPRPVSRVSRQFTYNINMILYFILCLLYFFKPKNALVFMLYNQCYCLHESSILKYFSFNTYRLASKEWNAFNVKKKPFVFLTIYLNILL